MRYRDDTETQTYCTSLLRAITAQWVGLAALVLLNLLGAALPVLVWPVIAIAIAGGWALGHGHRCPGGGR